jgi:hypothetical protein
MAFGWILHWLFFERWKIFDLRESELGTAEVLLKVCGASRKVLATEAFYCSRNENNRTFDPLATPCR